MKYFKTIENGYIVAVQTVSGQTEINANEYNSLLEIIHNKPIANNGFEYKLKEDSTWELCEVPEAEYEEKIALEN